MKIKVQKLRKIIREEVTKVLRESYKVRTWKDAVKAGMEQAEKYEEKIDSHDELLQVVNMTTHELIKSNELTFASNFIGPEGPTNQHVAGRWFSIGMYLRLLEEVDFMVNPQPQKLHGVRKGDALKAYNEFSRLLKDPR